MTIVRKKLHFVLWILVLLGVVGAGWCWYRYYVTSQKLRQEANNGVRRTVDHAEILLEKRFTDITHAVHGLSEWLSTNTFDDNVYKQKLTQLFKANEDIFGAVLAYVPDKQNQLHALYYVKVGKDIEIRPLTYHYTLPSDKAGARTEWYGDSIKLGNVWSEPFYGTASGQHVITYSERFYAPDDTQHANPMGVICAVITLEYLRNVVNSLELGAAGYGFVISRKGIYATHPIASYYLKERTMFDVAQENKSLWLQRIFQEITKNDYGAISYYDDISGHKATLLFRAITGTNFIMAASFLDEELLLPYAKLFHHFALQFIVAIIMALSLVLLLVIVTYFRIRVILLGGLIAFLFLLMAGILAIWLCELHYVASDTRDHIMLNQYQVNKFIEQFKVSPMGAEAIIPVKTGLLIQSVRYVGSSQVYLAGLLWQRYPIIEKKPLKYAFYIPACERFYYKDILSQFKQNDEEVIVWGISGLFNQTNISSQNYPFDRQDINFTVEYPDIQRGVLLVPDFASYQFVSPRLLPGLQKGITLEGHKLLQSYFVVQQNESGAAFGSEKKNTVEAPYNLCFLIGTERFLGGVLIVYLLPVLVALFFLSAIPFFATKTFTTNMQAISACAGIFMAMSFVHSSMRKTMVESGGINYLEYFFIFLYILICVIIAYVILCYLAPRTSKFAHEPKPMIILGALAVYLVANFIVALLTFWS